MGDGRLPFKQPLRWLQVHSSLRTAALWYMPEALTCCIILKMLLNSMVDGGLSLPRMNALPFILPVSPGPSRLKRLPFNWTVNNSLWFPSVYRCIDLITVKEVKVFFLIRKVSTDTRSLKLLDIAIKPLLLCVTVLLSFHLFVKSKTMVLLLESEVLENRSWTWSLWAEFRGLWTWVRNNFILFHWSLVEI